MIKLWEKWFGRDVQDIFCWWEARTCINIAYDTLNDVEVLKAGLKPFSKNVSNRKYLIYALCFKDAMPELWEKC